MSDNDVEDAFDALAHRSMITVWWLDSEGVIQDIKGNGAGLLNLKNGDSIGHRVRAFVPELAQLTDEALRGDPAHGSVKTSEGRTLRIGYYRRPDGGLIGSAVDVTDYADTLALLREKQTELEELQTVIVSAMLGAAATRLHETEQHTTRVGLYAGVLASKLGWNLVEVQQIEVAAQLHDIGKLAVPEGILFAPRALTEFEFALVKRHAEVGGVLLNRYAAYPLMKMGSEIAWSHHERWDGSGYPAGLKGEDIPESGRITAVCDFYDAMLTPRSYRLKPYSLDHVIDVLDEGRAKDFCPHAVDALLASLPKLRDISEENPDEAGRA